MTNSYELVAMHNTPTGHVLVYQRLSDRAYLLHDGFTGDCLNADKPFDHLPSAEECVRLATTIDLNKRGPMPAKDDTQLGIYEKYRVTRTDGRSERGQRHEGCQYFVLDLNHDPFAFPALHAYIAACRATHPLLAEDLQRMIRVFGHVHA